MAINLKNLGYNILSTLAAPVTGLAKAGAALKIPGAQSLSLALSPKLSQGPWNVNLSQPQQTQPKNNTPTSVGKKTTSGGGASVLGGVGGGLTPNLIGTENVFNPESFDWEGMFRPAFEGLEQQAIAARSSTDALINEIIAGGQEAEGLVRASEAEQRASLEESGKKSYQEEESNVSQLARTRGEAEQGAMSRFGVGSSAGQAATDIVNQSFARAVGQAQQQGIGIRDALAGEGRRLTNFVTTQIQNVTRQTDSAKQQARAQLENVLAQISTAKGQLQAQKAGQMYSALENYKNKLLEIDQANVAIKNNIGQFNAQLQAQLSAAAGSVSDNSLKIYQTLVDRGMTHQQAAAISGLAESPEQLSQFPVTSTAQSFLKSSDLLGQTSFLNPTTQQTLSSSLFSPTPKEDTGSNWLSKLIGSITGR